MASMYFKMTGAELVANGSKAALREITRRAKKRGPVTTAKLAPVRTADPAKALAAVAAEQAGPRGSTAWWTAYRAERRAQAQPLAVVAA